MSALLASADDGSAATNDLGAALQTRLVREEGHHNLDAAIQAYQSVSTNYEKDRKLAATALFRLGVSYRKQGKTNESHFRNIQRVLREFSDSVSLGRILAARCGVGVPFPDA